MFNYGQGNQYVFGKSASTPASSNQGNNQSNGASNLTTTKSVMKLPVDISKLINESNFINDESDELVYDSTKDYIGGIEDEKFLKDIGFDDITISKNNIYYDLFKILENKCLFYKTNFKDAKNKIVVYEKYKETLEQLTSFLLKYKKEQQNYNSITNIIENILRYLESNEYIDNNDERILFLNNLKDDLSNKILKDVIFKYYSHSIVNLIDSYTESKIKSLVKTKETYKLYDVLINNKIKTYDVILLSENNNFDTYKIFILLNTQQNKNKYLLNVINLQSKKQEQIQVTELNNSYCIIDNDNKIKGIKIGEYKNNL